MLTGSYGGWRLCVCRRFNLVHLGAFPVPEFVQLDWERQRDAVLKDTEAEMETVRERNTEKERPVHPLSPAAHAAEHCG